MLKVRAALEEKLKQKGVFSSIKKHSETKKRPLPLNGYINLFNIFCYVFFNYTYSKILS